MALRIPGKGNFKPVKPLKPGVRRPPVVGASQPKSSQPGISQAGPSRPTPSAPRPASKPAEPSPRSEATATPTEEPSVPVVAPAVELPLESQPPTVVAPKDDIVSQPEGLARTATSTLSRPGKKSKPLLAAAAASGPTPKKIPEKTPAPEKSQDVESVEPQPSAIEVPPTLQPAPTQDEDWAPPVVVSIASPEASSSWLPPTVAPASSVDDSLPPSVAPASSAVPLEEEPPAVSSTRKSRKGKEKDSATLAAALVASITAGAPDEIEPDTDAIRPKRKGAARKVVDAEVSDETPEAAPKRRRTARARKTPSAEVEDEDGDDEEIPEPTGLEDIPKKRGPRGKYGSRGRAGTAADRRTKAYQQRSSSKTVSHPELDGVEVDSMVGVAVNPTTMRMGDLATTLVSQGRVSARTLKLHQFTRNEDERKRKERQTRAENNWRRRQVVRRKHRELKNALRAERREAAKQRGEDPDQVVSDDSVDSDEDFDPEPDRLTPPGSPRQAERVAPMRIDREEEETEEAAEGEGVGENGTAAPAHDDEDIEGLGFVRQNKDDEDEEMGEEIDGFQLPVDDDPPLVSAEDQDFSGLAYSQYTGGHFDDEGNWVEGGPNVAFLQQRNEEHRRRILEGDDDRQVELIDNDTQFINSATWGKKVSNDRWTIEETELFFSVLRETGENYTLMKAYFPGRTFKQLKNKGARENRQNPQRMTDCIFNRKPMDKEYLTKSAGFNSELPYDRENAFLDEVAKEKERIKHLGPENENAEEDEEAFRLDDDLEFAPLQ